MGPFFADIPLNRKCSQQTFFTKQNFDGKILSRLMRSVTSCVVQYEKARHPCWPWWTKHFSFDALQLYENKFVADSNFGLVRIKVPRDCKCAFWQVQSTNDHSPSVWRMTHCVSTVIGIQFDFFFYEYICEYKHEPCLKLQNGSRSRVYHSRNSYRPFHCFSFCPF